MCEREGGGGGLGVREKRKRRRDRGILTKVKIMLINIMRYQQTCNTYQQRAVGLICAWLLARRKVVKGPTQAVSCFSHILGEIFVLD